MRVVIVDDQELTRLGVRTVLSGDDSISVVGETALGEEAADLCSETDADVVVLDLRLGPINGLELVPWINSTTHSSVLMLSAYLDRAYMRRARELGAMGYVHKDAAARVLRQAVVSVASGQHYFSNEQRLPSRRASHTPEYGDSSALLPRRLTSREHEVLQKIAAGETDKQIAAELGLSIRTVQSHVRGLLAKLGARNRTEAALLAQRAKEVV